LEIDDFKGFSPYSDCPDDPLAVALVGAHLKSKDDPSAVIPADSETQMDQTHEKIRDALIGVEIGRYKILDKVAKGGTATVYRALDNVLHREVAVKILHEHLEGKREIVDRFKKEAQVIAQLRHPNIVNIYDFLEYQARAVIVAEYMPGITLSALIKRVKKIPEDIVLMIGLEILHGLKAAHEKGVTHRDIKPANILVHPELGIKISDFGLAKITQNDDGLTKEGIFVGTPSFSSPEQIEGRPMDHRSDIFSLGLTLYMLATRAHAFKKHGDSTTTVWFKIVKGSFDSARIHNPDLSKDLERILDRALEVDVGKRYQTAEEMIDDIEKILIKRDLIPYQSDLRSFLKAPDNVHGIVRGNNGISFVRILTATIVICLATLGSAALYFYKDNWLPPAEPERDPSAQIHSPITTSPDLTIAKPAPNSSELTSPTKAPTAADAGTAVDKRNDEAKKIVKHIKPVRTVETIVTAIPIVESDVQIVASSKEAFPGLSFQNVNSHWELAKDSDFQKIVFQGDASPQHRIDLRKLDSGYYFWRSGDQTGELKITTFEAYRSHSQPTKRAVSVSSQFGDVDLELNPYLQKLQLSWQAGPEAKSYRIEVSSEPQFQNLLFSGTSVNKFTTIERSWEKSQSIYWRVSYLDENRNVFLVDDIRKINLKLSGSPTYFDVSENPHITKDSIEVSAVGPAEGSFRCLLNRKSEGLAEPWTDAQWSAGTWKAVIPLTKKMAKGAGWLLCKAEPTDPKRTIYFSLPL